MLGRRIGLAVATALAMGAASTAAVGFAQPAPQVTANVPARRKKGLFNGKVLPTYTRHGSYPRKDRMNTAAQHKRASAKARGIAKHRRHA